MMKSKRQDGGVLVVGAPAPLVVEKFAVIKFIMFEPPDVSFDEYGRTFCKAHGRQKCHICCMSFTDMNEEINENPSDRE